MSAQVGGHAKPKGSSGPMNIADITGVANSHIVGADAAAKGGAAFQRYEKLEKLGEGTYGVVYQARDTVRGCLVALKKVPMDAWDEGVPATALREISVLKEVRHPNIVALEDVFVSYHGNLYLVFELANCDLKLYLDHARKLSRAAAASGLSPAVPGARTHSGGLDPAVVRWLLYQLLAGMEACHAHRIVHRDLKPQNILLNPSGSLKLADFGLARTYAIPLRPYTHEVVTLWYRCPEILLGQETYSTAVDLWSAGCIFAEMASARPLFTGDSEIDQLFKIFQQLGTPTASVWPAFPTLPDHLEAFPRFRPRPWSSVAPELDDLGRDLLSRMLVYDPAARISAAEALAHPYFATKTPVPLPDVPPRMDGKGQERW